MEACPEPDEITRFVQGDLERARAEQIEVHLDSCQDCALVVSELVKIWSDDFVSDSAGSGQGLLPSLPSQDATVMSRAEDQAIDLGLSVLPAGSDVGPYKVLEVVGVGGMGVVYSAYDPELDRRVALKVLRPTAGQDAQRRNARLQREAQAMAKLSHPNVITVHHVGKMHDRVFIAMEFVQGPTLGQWMKEHRRNWREIRDTFAAAGEGLAAAHVAGLVHRDFKPDNVLIGDDGRVRVTDFGLARFRDDAPEPTTSQGAPTDDDVYGEPQAPSGPVGPGPTLTRTGALVGTPAYMAPEQYDAGAITAATDQFAFCVAMYEAVYGTRPFAGSSLAELAANVCSGEIKPLADGPVPGRVARAIRRGLSVKPSERFANMGELLAVINRRPRRNLRRWAVVTVPSLVAAAALWSYRTDTSAEIGFCRDAGEIETVWGDERKDTVARSFIDTKLPYSPEATETVLATIDAYAAEWSAIREKLCDDEGGEFEANELLAMHCLLEQRARLDTLVGVFENADEAVVNRSINATQMMASALDCVNARAQGDPLPLPSVQESEAVDRIREGLARAKALVSAGKFHDALAAVEPLAQEAAALSYEPLKAETKLALGRILSKLGQADQARAALEEATYLGVEARHRRVTAEAWIELVFLLAARLGDLEDAHRAHRAAEAELSGLDDVSDLRRKLLVYSGTMALVEERYPDARDIYQRVLHGDSKEPSVQRATLLMNLGSVQAKLGKPDEAVQYYEQAVGMFVEQFGQVHPRVAGGYYNLGVVLLEEGVLDDALSQFEQAYKLEEATLGRTHPQHAETASAMGMTYVRMGRLDDAIAHFQESMQILAESGSAQIEVMEMQRSSLIEALLEAGRLDEAEAELRHGREELDGAQNAPSTLEVAWHYVSSRVSRARGRHEEARSSAKRAVDLANASGDVDRSVHAVAIAELASAEADVGEHQVAADLMQQAMSSPFLEHLDALDRADFGFQRAQHLWDAGHREVAHDEARSALVVFDDAAMFDEVAEVEAWLAKR